LGFDSSCTIVAEPELFDPHESVLIRSEDKPLIPNNRAVEQGNFLKLLQRPLANLLCTLRFTRSEYSFGVHPSQITRE
jgi:hypothetical protein